ncbi:MAG: xanthine phosphoribosyltransferase [Buchnera aphidicola (Tetraneura sorini)]
MIERHIVTWDMLQIYTKNLAKKLFPICQWKGIIAVSRGGLVPAAILSRELGIRCVDTVCISSYDEENSLRNIKIIKKALGTGNKMIVVDDLVDTGRTAKKIKFLYPDSFFVTVFAKPSSKILVDDYVIDVPQNIWIELPWDMSISYKSPINKN